MGQGHGRKHAPTLEQARQLYRCLKEKVLDKAASDPSGSSSSSTRRGGALLLDSSLGPWSLVLGLFAVLPYVRTGTAGHVTLARCALVFYVAGLIQAAW